MKAAYIQKTIYLIFLLAVLFSAGCGTKDQSEPDPIGIKIKSPKFDEISTIYSDVEVLLKFSNSQGFLRECDVMVGTDTKVKGSCGEIPFGSYIYELEYKYQDLIIAKSIGSITIDENNTETPITLLDKNIDEDNDGCSNLQEVIVGSNPLVQDTCIPPPTDLTAKSVSTTRIDLTWIESAGATGYKIFRREGAEGADTEIGTSTQTSYSDTGLNADTEYCYKVSAIGNGVEAIPTDLVCAKTEKNDLVAFYPFNGNANDESGNGNHGTVNGPTLTADRFGNADSAYSFDGVNDYVSIGNPANLKITGAITVGAWIKLTSSSIPMDAKGFRSSAVLSKWGQNANLDSFWLGLNQKDDVIRIIGGIGVAGSPDVELFSGGLIQANEFNHIAMTYDSITGVNKLYLNGQEVAYRLRPGGIFTSDINVLIGREVSDSVPRFFQGLIDDVRIYDRVLSDSELLLLSASQWKVSDGGNGHFYKAIHAPQGISWTDANAAAQAMSGNWHLATVTSANENAFVYGLVNKDTSFWNCCLSGNSAGPWIGGLKVGSGVGDYGWVTGEPFTYKNWGPYEPFGNGDRIGLFGYQKSMGPYWNDVPASRLEFGYIVETSTMP